MEEDTHRPDSRWNCKLVLDAHYLSNLSKVYSQLFLVMVFLHLLAYTISAPNPFCVINNGKLEEKEGSMSIFLQSLYIKIEDFALRILTTFV